MRLVRVQDLKPGDMVDLTGDMYADVEEEQILAHEMEFSVVEEPPIQETPESVLVYFENDIPYGFPTDHKVKVDSNFYQGMTER